MQNVDRMFLHLVHTIRARYPNLLTQPFAIGELAQTVLPYRHHRRELGVENNDDYEITLVHLLASDYVIVDDEVRDAMRAELASPNPDPSAYRKFTDSQLAVSPNALRAMEAASANPQATSAAPSEAGKSPSPNSPTATPVAGPRPVTPSAPPSTQPSPMATRPSGGQGARTPASSVRTDAPKTPARGIVPEKGDTCRFCDGVLPPARPITFCPHCGQNLAMSSCPACGSELEVSWRFCPSCGRRATSQ